MKSISVIVSIVLLCQCHSSEFAQKVKTKPSFLGHHELQSRRSSEEKTESKIKFIDLNEDVIRLIFDALDFLDLMNMADISTQFEYFASKTFGQRYRHFEIIIREPIDILPFFIRMKCAQSEGMPSAERQINEKYCIKSIENRFEINDHDLALNALKHFGGCMRKLSIDNNILDGNHSTAINRFVNEYAAESLTFLNLGLVKHDTLALFTKPFNSVKEFICFMKPKQIGPIVRLNRMFPQLSRLTLFLHSDSLSDAISGVPDAINRTYEFMDLSFIDCELPKLEFLNFGLPGESVWRQKDKIEGLFRRNHQILSIEFSFFPRGYMNDINKLLPNIQNLTIHDDLGDDEIRFENVKHILLCVSRVPSIDKLTFPRIESIQMIFDTQNSEAWIRFFKKHQNLSKLHIQWHGSAVEIELLRIVHVLRNLKEIQYFGLLSIDGIIGIIENQRKLMRFELSMRSLNDPDLAVLREQFEHEWHIHEMNSRLLIERKNDTVLE